MRNLITALLLVLGLSSPALAAPCGPIPALPDTERRTEYLGVSSSTGPFNVAFQLYGDSTDYGNWLEVWVNGVKKTAVTDYTVATASGPALGSTCLPITNAQVTFLAAQTGTIEIVGARRPRRASQFSENVGVTAHALNQVISDLTATERERWDALVRTLRAPPGDTLTPLPPAATRASGILGFDAAGNPSIIAPTIGLGTVIGPNSSVDGHIALFDGATGQKIKDGGVLSISVAGPATSTSGNFALWNSATGNLLKDGPAVGALASLNTATLATGGLGGSQAGATANQIPVFPGAGGAAVPTSAPSWFDSAYCNTVGYLIVRVSGAWTCNNSIPANVDWFANVAGDGATDDTAGINVVLAAVNGRVQFSSKAYCVKTAGGLTTSKANQILEGTAGTLISACGTDSNLLTINGDSIQVRNISFLGGGLTVSSNHHDIVMGNGCTRCRIDHVVTAGGYYNVLINAAYTFIYDLRTGNAHGPAVIKMIANGGSSPGLYMDASQIDQSWPVSAPSALASISAWASNHAYTTTGTVVSTGGYYIQQSSGSCTSNNGAAPTLLDYGLSITDGTCTWKLVAPTTFDGLSVDTGSVNTVVTRSDFTGPYTNGIHLHNSAAGTAPLETDLHLGNTYAQNLTACINAEAGTVLTISAQQCQSGVMTTTIGVWLKTTFTGNYQIESSSFITLGTSSAGILDQAANNGGTIAHNLIYTGGGTGISIGANVNNRSIIGNHGGLSSLGSNASCIFVSPGTSDYLSIVGNVCNGATSSQITITGVTGTHNTISNAGTYGSCITGGPGILQSPAVTVDFNVAGDTLIPIQLPPGCTRVTGVAVHINKATADIHTATFGLHTATGGGGTHLLADLTAITITATADNTNNNSQITNVTNILTETYTPVAGLLYFRNPGGVTGTANVVAQFRPMP